MRVTLTANIVAALVGMFAAPDITAQSLTLVPAFGPLRFTQPVGVHYANDGTNRLYVVEQGGRIISFNRDTPADTTCFLDIRDKVTAGAEMGLLGLAFDPVFRENGRFYVHYTRTVHLEDHDQVQVVIARYQLQPGEYAVTAADTAELLLVVDKPHGNHNGGQLAFGPDGYLYISLGDGSMANDEQHSAQDLRKLLGKILRIDVRWNNASTSYGIPPGNPFASDTNGYRKEIYAYGLRNPWRFSFDPVTWNLWVGDVGQENWEEINLVERGGNYGWSRMEGTGCFPAGSGCDITGCTLPIWMYSHGPGGGVAITGGYVYRGSAFPALYGKYIYGDFGTGRIWVLTLNPITQTVTNNQLLMNTDEFISSFGVDETGELFVCGYTGRISRFASTASVAGGTHNEPAIAFTAFDVNPVSPSIKLAYHISQPGMVQLALYDLGGREVMQLVQEMQSEGEHHLEIPKASLAEGFYLCRLSSNGRVVSQGIRLMR